MLVPSADSGTWHMLVRIPLRQRNGNTDLLHVFLLLAFSMRILLWVLDPRRQRSHGNAWQRPSCPRGSLLAARATAGLEVVQGITAANIAVGCKFSIVFLPCKVRRGNHQLVPINS